MRRELALERRALGLEPRRQREALAERLERLVDEEARAVGGDLEQDPVGHAEVDRAEVLAVLTAGRAQAELDEAGEPAPARRRRRAPGDVVRDPGADQRRLLGRLRERERRVLGEEAGVEVGLPIATTSCSAGRSPG